jgi:hypothetical protein
MSSKLATACHALTELFVQLIDEDEGLRESLNALALKLVLATKKRESPSVNGQIHKQTAPALNGAPPEVKNVNECLPTLTLGRTPPVITEGLAERIRNRPRIVGDQDVGEIEAHSRLKAEAMRWASTRQRLLRNGASYREIAPTDRELLDRVKGRTDCYLWMLSPNFRAPIDLTLLEDAARCFNLMADALKVARRALGDPEIEEQYLSSVMEILAYAQSALRVAVARVGDRADADQVSVYGWLRSTGDRKRIYLERYMRLDDPADPSNLDEILSVLSTIDEQIDVKRQGVRRRKACLGKLRYHAKSIRERGETQNDRKSMIEAVEELLHLGVPTSNVEIRESLLPIIDQLSEGSHLPKGFSLVLRDIKRFMNADLAVPFRSPTPINDAELELAASLVAGKTAVIIGGELRPLRQEAIKTALRLKDLIWIGACEIRSTTELETHVARPEVAVVLLAIRWSPHSFGDVSRFCERHGKPLVRLPGGYHPRQVSVQILAQCGDRLARAKATEQPSLHAQVPRTDRS